MEGPLDEWTAGPVLGAWNQLEQRENALRATRCPQEAAVSQPRRHGGCAQAQPKVSLPLWEDFLGVESKAFVQSESPPLPGRGVKESSDCAAAFVFSVNTSTSDSRRGLKFD